MVLPPLAIAGPDQDATVVPSFSEKTVVRPHPEEHRERSFSIDTRKTVYASLIVRSGVKGTLPPPARPVIGRRPHSQYGRSGHHAHLDIGGAKALGEFLGVADRADAVEPSVDHQR